MEFKINPALQKLIEEEIKSGCSTNPDEFLDKAVYHYVIARDLAKIFPAKKSRKKSRRVLPRPNAEKQSNARKRFDNSETTVLNAVGRERESSRAYTAGTRRPSRYLGIHFRRQL